MLNPVALQLGPLSIHWYGILYGAALAVGLWIMIRLNRTHRTLPSNDTIFDLAFWIFLGGVIAGGRLGYVLFYDLSYFIRNPLQIVAVWNGGMSFHGGLIGSLIVGILFCGKRRIPILPAGDLIVIPGAIGQAIGRIGNLINRELWGRPITNLDWQFLGMDFGDHIPRWPAPLFHSIELLTIFLILLGLYRKHPRAGTVFFAYLLLNGGFRFFTEFFREPDAQIGFILRYFTLGQVFSIALAAAGIAGVILTKRQ